MPVNFGVTDATRPILSVNEGAVTAATKPYGGREIIRDAVAIQKTTQILYETEGLMLSTKTVLTF